MPLPPLPTRREVDAGVRTFASGLLLDLVSALRATAPGDLVGVTSVDPSAIGPDLEAWSRLTGHAIVAKTTDGGRARWVIRHGAVGAEAAGTRPPGERLWLYLNFDCNLRCDYCCVRSSPTAPRRALDLERVRRIASEAAELGISEI